MTDSCHISSRKLLRGDRRFWVDDLEDHERDYATSMGDTPRPSSLDDEGREKEMSYRRRAGGGHSEEIEMDKHIV